MLVDTDMLIWHLRGYPQAARRLDQLPTLTLSSVSCLEVLQGLRNKAELQAVQTMLQRRQATTLPITEAITRKATELMEAMMLSHGLMMGDALIAATALEHGLPLLTGNVRHFAAIPSLLIEGFEVWSRPVSS
jgi:predicted nucleic acid-binding protein